MERWAEEPQGTGPQKAKMLLLAAPKGKADTPTILCHHTHGRAALCTRMRRKGPG